MYSYSLKHLLSKMFDRLNSNVPYRFHSRGEAFAQSALQLIKLF